MRRQIIAKRWRLVGFRKESRIDGHTAQVPVYAPTKPHK
jgi:hypothetical protein